MLPISKCEVYLIVEDEDDYLSIFLSYPQTPSGTTIRFVNLLTASANFPTSTTYCTVMKHLIIAFLFATWCTSPYTCCSPQEAV